MKTIIFLFLLFYVQISKCPVSVCVNAKHAKRPFKSIIVRETEPLELVHSNLVDFKNTLSRGGKILYHSRVIGCNPMSFKIE